MSAVRERGREALGSIPQVSTAIGCNGIIDRVRHSGRVLIAQDRKPRAVAMSLAAYRAQQKRLRVLEETLDHVLLYLELQIRRAEPHGEITLEELRRR